MSKTLGRNTTEPRRPRVPSRTFPKSNHQHDADEYLGDLQSSFLEVTEADECLIKPAPDWREVVGRWLGPANSKTAIPAAWIRVRQEGAKSAVTVNLVLASPVAQIIVTIKKKRGLADVLDNLTTLIPKVFSHLCLRWLREEADTHGWRRLIQVLHNGPLQIATAAKVRLQARRHGVGDPTAAKTLDEAIALVGQVITAMRALLQDRVQPSGSDTFTDRLRQAAGRWGELTGMRVHFSFPGAPSGAAAFSKETLEIAEHIVREGIVNAWKHGRATQVSVSCEPHNGGILLTLRDDGRGFRSSIAPKRQDGTKMGLRLLRSRVGELGGRFDIRSSRGRGTVVKTWLPRRRRLHEGRE